MSVIVRICKACVAPIDVKADAPLEPGTHSAVSDFSDLCRKCEDLVRTRTEIKVQERKQSDVWVVEIDPFFKASDRNRGFRCRISVYSKLELSEIMPTGDEEWRRVWTRAEVSWSSVGSVRSTEATDFSEAIRIAAQYGAAMDAEHGITKK